MAAKKDAKKKDGWQKFDVSAGILLLGVAIPVSMFLWAGNRTLRIIKHSEDGSAMLSSLMELKSPKRLY